MSDCQRVSPAFIIHPSDRNTDAGRPWSRTCRLPLLVCIIEASGRPFNSSAPIVFDQPDCVHAAMSCHGPWGPHEADIFVCTTWSGLT